MRKALFLDRDGTLNSFVLGEYITHPDEIELLDGAVGAIQFAHEWGYLIIVVTNQGGAIAKAGASTEQIEAINQRLVELLAGQGALIDSVKYCPHYPPEKCTCRKPESGLLEQAIAEFDINREQSYMVGDFDSDIQAGKSAGVKTIKIGNQEAVEADHYVSNIREIIPILKKGE
jgi:D-glycero-D-manno-heptose 1,7-bisphosphate phosphatase